MKPHEAKLILKRYQEWRLGANTEILDPKIITEAINVVLKEFNPIRPIKRINA